MLDKARVVNRDTFKRPKNIHIVELSTEDKIGLLNTFDYPPENVINAYLDYLNPKVVHEGFRAICSY